MLALHVPPAYYQNVLTIYRRHLKTCPHQADRFYRRCACPVWVIGMGPHGDYHRHTLHTFNWSVAEESRRKIEAGDTRNRVEVQSALDDWLAALRSAKRKERTVSQVHGAMARNLAAWCRDSGYAYLDRLTLPVLDQFIATWRYASTTHRSRIDLMRSFFKFCVNRQWLPANPAAGLIKPAEDMEPTLPFTADEERKIFAAADRFAARPNFGGLWATHPETAHALLYILRWTGLRASDAVTFEPYRIEAAYSDGRFVPVYGVHQMKTGEWVMCPIPPIVAASIQNAPRLSDGSAFIPPDGHRDARSVSNNFYSTYLRPLGTLAGVPGVRAHRFRDTFAVRLLESGKSLETVSVLLGHSSIKTTERHYAPWVRSRQDALIREMRDMWH